MKLSLNARSIPAGLLLVLLVLGLLVDSEPAAAADRTVIGELFSRDG